MVMSVGQNMSTSNVPVYGTVHFKKYKLLFEYQHLLLLRDIWGQSSNLYLNVVHFFQHQC